MAGGTWLKGGDQGRGGWEVGRGRGGVGMDREVRGEGDREVEWLKCARVMRKRPSGCMMPEWVKLVHMFTPPPSSFWKKKEPKRGAL